MIGQSLFKPLHGFMLVLLLFGFPGLSVAQFFPELPLEQRSIQAQEMWAVGDYKPCKDSLKVWLKQPRSAKEQLELSLIKVAIQSLRGKEKSADNALMVADSIMRSSNQFQAYLTSFNLAQIAYFLCVGDYEATEKLKSLEESFDQALETAPCMGGYLAYLRGLYHLLMVPDAEKMKEYFLRSIEVNTQCFGSTYFLNTSMLRNLGIKARQQAEFEKAIDFHRKELAILEAHQQEKTMDKGRAWYNTASLWHEMGEAKEATFAYEKALEQWEKDPPPQAFLRYTYDALGDQFWQLGQEDKSMFYWQEAAKLTPPRTDPAEEKVRKGDLSMQQGSADKALTYYRDALEIREKAFGPNHYLTGSCYSTLASAFERENNQEEAIRFYQNAIHAFIPDYPTEAVFQSPSIADAPNDHYLIKAIQGKGNLLFREWKKNRMQLQGLKAAFQSLDLAARLLERLRQRPQVERSRLFWRNDAFAVYEDLIQIAITCFETFGDPYFLKQAFQASERSKAFLLTSSFKEVQLNQFYNVPESVRLKEDSLRASIRLVSQFIQQEQSLCGQASANKLSGFQNQLLLLEAEYEQFGQALSEEYPKYYQLRYQPDTLVLQDLQDQLYKNGASLLSFVEGQTQIYAFLITPSDLSYQVIPFRDSERSLLDSFVQNLQNWSYWKNKSDLGFTYFTQSAHGLYQLLLQPFEDQLSSSTRLILAPDGHLSALPFSCLIKALPKKGEQDFQKLNYALRTWIFSYASSATIYSLQQGVQREKRRSRKVLGIAPAYKGMANQRPLLHNVEEIEQISALFPTTQLAGVAATEGNFKKMANRFGILHFAMHAEVDHENPQQSRIIFQPSAGEDQDGNLYAYELFDMNLKADLVVLSACNTGIGTWYKGEGTMSLSRAFEYAGCRSVLPTLWPVDDASMASIMAKFYTELRAYEPKDLALQTACTAYLKESDPLFSHPYFWAGLYFIGDTAPLQKPGFPKYLLLLLFIPLYWLIYKQIRW